MRCKVNQALFITACQVDELYCFGKGFGNEEENCFLCVLI